MRIAVWHNLPSGGGKRALHDHLRGLVARGHVVETWCPASADREFLPLAEFGPEHVLPWHDPRPEPWFFSDARREPMRLDTRAAAMHGHCEEAAKQMTAGRFDVAMINTCRFVHAAPLGRYLKIPRVMYLQEPARALYEALPDPPFAAPAPAGRSRLAPWFLRQRLANAFRTPALRRQIREEAAAARAVDRLLVNSHFSRESVLRAYGLDSAVCYLGVDAARFGNRNVPREDFLLGVGGVTPNKNLEFVLRALARLDPRPRLVWAGNAADGRYRREIERLAADLRVDLTLRILVSDAALADLYASAAMLVYAPRLEPFGYAPLEANAAGTPVVAVAEGGLRETVRDGVNGLLVEATSEAMAAGIRRLRDNPALARELGERGRKVVAEEWSLDRAIDRLESHLVAVCRGPS